VDGLFREMTRMASELHQNPKLIPASEVEALGRRVACALLATPWQVVSAVNPDMQRSEVQAACPQQRGQPQRGSASGTLQQSVTPGQSPTGLANPTSPAEREAEYLAERIFAGHSVAGQIRERPGSAIQRHVRVETDETAAEQVRAAFERLMGRTVTISGGRLTLGEAVPGSPGSPSVARFLVRAIDSSTTYRVRSSATRSDGSAVRGSAWQAGSDGIVIMINPAEIPEYTLTIEQLLTAAFVGAVAATEPSEEPVPRGTVEAGGGMTLDRLLSTPLPYSSPEMLDRALDYIQARIPAIDIFQRGDLHSQMLQGRNVTLAEILRGLETNTPYQIRREESRDFLTITFIDPRTTTEPGAAQPIPLRQVSFPTGPARGRGLPAPQPAAELREGGLTDENIAEAERSCNEAMLREIRAHLVTARAYMSRTLERLAAGTDVSAPMRRHFGTAGTPANRSRIAANLRVIASDLDFSRHAWVCNPRGSGTAGCNDLRVSGRSSPGRHPVQFCVERSAPHIPRWTSLLHEVVHTSGIGTLPAGVETYEWQEDRYPGSDTLHNADSYAKFVRDVGAPTAGAARARPIPARLSALVQGGVSVVSGEAQPVVGARLELTPLGSGLSVVDFTSGLTFLWLPQYGVVPPSGGPDRDVTDRYYAGIEAGARFNLTERPAAYIDVTGGVGTLWPGGTDAPDFAATLRGTLGLQYGTPSAGLTAGIDFRGLLDAAETARGGWVVGLGIGGYFGGPEEGR
jgi:hypothetical protein